MSDVYGNDLLFFDGDFTADNDGDLMSTKDYEALNPSNRFDGYYNIFTALTDRLLTNKGDNVFHPDYGSDLGKLLSSPASSNTSSSISDAISRALSEDERVESVESVVVSINGSVVNAKVRVILYGANRVAEFVFPSFVLE